MAEPTLALRCRISADALVVDYRIDNRGDAELLTYDGAPGLALPGAPPSLAGQVYVSFIEPDTVALKRIRPPLPKDIDLTFAFVPSVYRLGPGERREVTFQLPLPLQEHSQYASPKPAAPVRRVEVRRLVLMVGYFAALPQTRLKPLAAPRVFRASGRYGPQRFVGAECPAGLSLDTRTELDFPRL